MSEEVPRVTKVEKGKDPRRVESGKRLAAISKLAKEKKAYERHQQQHMERIDEEEGCSTVTVIAGGGALAGLICLYLYFAHKWGEGVQTVQPTSPVVAPSAKMISLDD